MWLPIILETPTPPPCLQAHIELNAIDLAWDTVARFSSLGLPQDFYADFARWANCGMSWLYVKQRMCGRDLSCCCAPCTLPGHGLEFQQRLPCPPPARHITHHTALTTRTRPLVCFVAVTGRRVADDEARHLLWCLQRMGELGYEYGCMPAHNLLWEGAEMSSGECSQSEGQASLFLQLVLGATVAIIAYA